MTLLSFLGLVNFGMACVYLTYGQAPLMAFHIALGAFALLVNRMPR